MAYIIAALMAGLSFLLNQAFIRYIGPVTIISLGPIAEEASKTLFAYYLGVDIIIVHAVFGIIEAAYDWYQDSERPAAGLLSIFGHSLFGAATAIILTLTGSVGLGLTAGVILHLAYNVAVVRLLAGKLPNN
ncbi:hypothetical protein SCACP_03160 [Sporomusa carbonis]|uniref:hypothetical protein n=1 Tax=Sporomusa carbonis TaxID=3076075 RepID=UPI003A77D3C0